MGFRATRTRCSVWADACLDVGESKASSFEAMKDLAIKSVLLTVSFGITAMALIVLYTAVQ